MAKRPGETKGGMGGPILLTWEKFQAVCATLEDCGAKYKAAEAHGFKYNTVRDAIVAQLQIGDTEWQDLWDESLQKFRESLEDEARERARDGWNEPVFHQGKVAGYVKKKSDRLLEVMLRAHIPDKYRDNVHVTGTLDNAGGGLDLLKDLSMEAKRKIRQIIIEDMEQQRALRATPVEALQIEGPE